MMSMPPNSAAIASMVPLMEYSGNCAYRRLVRTSSGTSAIVS